MLRHKRGKSIVVVETILIIDDLLEMTSLKLFFLKYRTTLGLAAFLFLTTLLLVTRYGLSPLASWTDHIVSRTSINVSAVPIGTMIKPVPIVGTGSIESPTSVPVTTGFSGSITDVYVVEGQSVKAGQPLIKLFGSVERSTESGVVAPGNQNGTANPQAQASYNNALELYNRDQKLYEQGAIPRRKVDNDAAQLQILQESLNNSQETASPAAASTTTTMSNGSATISAPINGIVTGLSATIDKGVQAGQQLMILDSGEVQVVIPIEQKDLYLVQLGTPATVEALGQTMLGQVISIFPELDANNIPSFRTHIKVTNDTGGILKKGMSANVHINTGKSVTVLAIPKTTISQDSQGLNYIYLASNGKALRQQITIGDPIGDLMEITATLPEQAMLITNSVSDIKDGDPIILLESI